MSPRHPWEADEPVAASHPWDAIDYCGDLGDSDDESDPLTDPLAASREVLDALLDQYLRSAISAATFCII